MKAVERFPYKSLIPGYPLQPLLDISIKGAGTFVCIVDSGANRSLFPKTVGVLLGIDYTQPPDARAECAHGEEIACWSGTATIRLRDEEFPIPAFFSDIDQMEPLLGREGFFERYRVTFDETSKEVIIEKRSISPRSVHRDVA